MKKEIVLDGSEPQKNIIAGFVEDKFDMLVDAIAGSGKTTLLMYLCSLCDKRVLYLAFNKSIKEETQEKFERYNFPKCMSKTMHSLGFLAITKSRKVVLKDPKWDLIKELQAGNKSVFKKMTWKEKSAISFSILDLHEFSRLYLTDDIKELRKILTEMDKFLNKTPYLESLWKDFLEIRDNHYSKPPGQILEIDFTDMIYLPVRFNLHIPMDPYYLFVDEVQDLNILQHTIVDMLRSQGTVQRTIYVGDRRQSIYGFSGAFAKSIDSLAARETVKEYPLNICYRCPTAILAEANEVYDVMLGKKEEEGIVSTITNVNEIKNNSLIICRNTEPLIDLYLELLSLDKPCVLKGEDILKGVTNFLKPFAKKTPYIANKEFKYQLEELEEDKTEEGRRKLYLLKENLKIFNKLIKIFDDEVGELSNLITRLKSLFVNKENAITLCTIHRSKGLEANIVYILDEKKTIPSKFAKSKQQLEQENNLKYVARTRSLKEMYYLNLK